MSHPKNPRQHIVPRIYLKAFAVDSPPEDWPAGRPFTPYVWVIECSLKEEPVRRAPSQLLWQRALYTLAAEDPSDPSIEKYLSSIESVFASTITKVLAEQPLSPEDMAALAVFTGALAGRTPGMMEHRQSQVDEIQGLYRQVERGATGSETASDEFWKGSDEAGRRLILTTAGSYASVILPYAWLFINQSPVPLVTSDQPVTHLFLHVDELAGNGFPPELLNPEAQPSDRAFVSLTPLAPHVAMLSSPLLVPPTDSFYWRSSNIRIAVALNEWTRHHAQKVILSKYRNPYGPIREHAIELERREEASPRASGLQIYTKRNRYWIPSEDVVHGHGSHVLIGRLTFTTAELESVRLAAADGELVEINVYSDGRQVGAMRNARFISVASEPGQPSVIEMVL